MSQAHLDIVPPASAEEPVSQVEHLARGARRIA